MRFTPRTVGDGESSPALVRVSGLGELAATVPYLLGFAPRESVTLVGLAHGRVGLTARVDLPAVLDPLAAPVLLDSVFQAIGRTDASEVVALVATDAERVDPVVAQRLRLAADRAGLQLRDVGWHRDEVCVSLLCDDPQCCPPGGVPVDPACAAAASATFAGVVVLPDREAVEAEFAEVGTAGDALDPLIAAAEVAVLRAVVDGDGDAHVEALAEQVLDLARLRDALVGSGIAPPPLCDADVATCLAALAHVGVRDAVWIAVDAREVHGQELWLELARRAPVPYDASPLFLLGWRCWRHGDGVRAVIAAELASATPGGYSAACLLLEAISACVDPRSVPPLSA